MSSPFNEEKYQELLKGLDIKIAMLSDVTCNKDFRIDSQFYTMAPILNPKLDYSKIGDVLKSSQYGISIEMNEDGDGYPIYRMNELHDMLCDVYVNKYANIAEETYERFALKDRDVIFNRTNSYEWVGRTGIYYQHDDIKRTFASYLVRLNPDTNKILPEYLCAFLNTKQGVNDIKRRARQSINQTNVNPEEVKEIQIPLLSKDFQLCIQQLFETANDKRLNSLRYYKEAEHLLLTELGYNDWQIDTHPTSIKGFNESFLINGRLDAEYYQRKYENYRSYIKKYKGGTNTLVNICNINDKNYCLDDKTEYKYIELSNIGNIGQITGCTSSLGAELPSRARRLVHTNDIIVSSVEGSLQSVAIVPEKYDNAICSTGFYVVNSTIINAETLLVLFKSEPIQNLLKQGCSGTILTAIGKTEFQTILLPIIDGEIQAKIACCIKKSISLLDDSIQLLEKAKLMVETEIERQ